ncbi:histidine kinase dimerization/phospho-acceptor domain-containing protein [Erwinia sp. V71]|uniref:histidine kinase dimerization/phospho-acceptor domain-containing protein n=1 Tax=Erwinia sp. V71 TaxID=3369424 RepID=UPI003F5F1CC7
MIRVLRGYGILLGLFLWPLSAGSRLPEASVDTPWFSQQEINWIKQHPVINVAMDINNPPYSLLDRDGEMTGLDADILQRITEKSGLNFNFIPATGPQAVSALLLAGKAQMTPARFDAQPLPATLLLSEPWDMLEWVMITRNERSAPVTLQTLGPLRVAIARGYPLLAARRLYPQLSVVEVDSALQAVELMLAGAADATFTSIGSARYLQASRYGDRIIVRVLANAREPERFAVVASLPLLRDILNKSQASIPPQELRALRSHWFSLASLAVVNTSLPPWVKLWGGALLVIALSSVFWGSYPARQVGRRKQAEYRLQELLAYWETLFNNVPTPLFVCAPDMTLTAANRYFCQAMALTLSQVVGRPLFSLQLLPAREQQAIRGIFLRCLAGDMAQFADRQILLQGQEREGYLWFEGYRNPAGVVQGVIGGWFDVTERKSLARELLLARDKAEQASDEKSAFLARMSHEIRTPLHAIIGILELAVKQRDAPSLQIAWQAAESLQEVVGDVLDFSTIEAGHIELKAQPVQLVAMLENCAATFRPRAQEKQLTLQSELALPASDWYLLDSVRLMQVINNLLLNAIKFTHEGGIWLRARQGGQTQEGDDVIVIDVEDSGCGIAPEKYQAVMQQWVREESAAAVPGSGLGCR